VPVLFIQATRDIALPPAMAAGMEGKIPKLTKKEVDTTHWALWEAPEQVNRIIREWIESAVGRGPQSQL
jgi:pimeloyl-ACP methyl ester carboxylesterase